MRDIYNARYLRPTDLATRLGVGRSTVYAWTKEGRIPQPYRLGPKAARYDVEATLAAFGLPSDFGPKPQSD